LEETLAVAISELVGTRGCLPLFFNVHGCHPMRGLIRLLGGCLPEVGGGRKPVTTAEKKKVKKRKKKRNATEFAYQQEEQKDVSPGSFCVWWVVVCLFVFVRACVCVCCLFVCLCVCKQY
jgi:hypothetical protein